ncbi:nicotinate-nucleotide--dimethylbenzimidazole phosphoribosyltransferase [Pseudobacteroides cellulosolvens]|uniref:Nicotinate-nucleotide--dimethylbenzimidazole phosphoribosyltransferase n=1 Tax=Pseudobacteroides cellulosolvens ATCC 35603 = DSM 2933 TaxID=398512 RepID=A0A0L6JL53_9FIRM|nr:nicotinate-nucleotide--dimethylbenzimidazole phosphoribosyltransferase [Pseudobacteroides cellulosolvens]KNY26509.1 Nicotinate-nucleotide--dimethylbenzimidazole phosphoribosyltransferase [Pseudobacteroides cellulosolvens ATCC 35603 = DSM 2933]
MMDKIIDLIESPDKSAMNEASKRLDTLIKPIGSLGVLEEISIKLAGIFGKVNNKIEKKCVVVMSADNGVCEEGVSTCPQFITIMQTINIIRGFSGVSVLAKHANSDIKVVDIGINGDVQYPGLINKKVKPGTSNMVKGPAMTRDEAVLAINTGIEIVGELVRDGYNLIGTGEMGIGNTSTSSAVLMAFTGLEADKAVGRGAGMTNEGYEAKKKTILKALELNKPDKNDAIDVLAKVGGLDIAGMAGCFLGGAYYKVPVVIDGFISAVAALVAYKINPKVKDYMIPSHISEEPGFKHVIEYIGLKPFLGLEMRLGEGSGCPIAFNVIEAATEIINKVATFEEVEMNSDFLIDMRKDC